MQVIWGKSTESRGSWHCESGHSFLHLGLDFHLRSTLRTLLIICHLCQLLNIEFEKCDCDYALCYREDQQMAMAMQQSMN